MVVIAKMKAKQGKEQELETALKDMVEKVKTEEGTLAYTLHRSMNDGTVFVLYEKYTDPETFGKHSETAHFKELMGITAPLLDGGLTVDLLEELAAL